MANNEPQGPPTNDDLDVSEASYVSTTEGPDGDAFAHQMEAMPAGHTARHEETPDTAEVTSTPGTAETAHSFNTLRNKVRANAADRETPDPRDREEKPTIKVVLFAVVAIAVGAVVVSMVVFGADPAPEATVTPAEESPTEYRGVEVRRTLKSPTE